MASDGTAWILLAGALGGLIGALLGASKACQAGTCPIAANPVRGGVVGALVGLLFALAAGVGSDLGFPFGQAPAGEDGLVEVTAETFEKTVGKGVVLVDFYSPQCGPCRQQLPILGELSREIDGKFRIVKVNVSREQALAERHRIRSIPTLMFFRDGVPVDTRVGLHGKIEILQAFAALPE